MTQSLETENWFIEHSISIEHGRLLYRLAPGGTAEIVDIMVTGEHRREGFGRAMFERLLRELPDSVRTVYAFVRCGNGIACDWYWALGFADWPVPGFYGDDDGLVMVYKRLPEDGP